MPSHDVFSFVGTEWGQSQKEKKMGYGRMNDCNPLISLAGQEGFEPPTPGFGVRCSNR